MLQNNLQRILLLIYALYPARFLTAAYFDNQRVGFASNQERIWISEGNLETVIAYLFYSVILILALFQVLETRKHLSLSPLIIFMFLVFSMSVIVNLDSWLRTDVAGMLLFFLILVLTDKAKVDPSLFAKIRNLHILILGLIVTFPVFNLDRSFTPCTFEKCSPFGTFSRVFFPTKMHWDFSFFLAVFCFYRSSIDSPLLLSQYMAY